MCLCSYLKGLNSLWLLVGLFGSYHPLDLKYTNSCKVPQHYKANRALGKWVAKQREQYRLKKNGEHSFLTDYRIEKLEQCGFAWQVRHSTLNSNHHTEDAVSNVSDEAAVLATASQHQQYQSEQSQQQSMNEENDDAAEDYEASMQDAVLQEFGKDVHV